MSSTLEMRTTFSSRFFQWLYNFLTILHQITNLWVFYELTYLIMKEHNPFWPVCDMSSTLTLLGWWNHTVRREEIKIRTSKVGTEQTRDPTGHPAPPRADWTFVNSLCRSVSTSKDHVEDLLLKTKFYFSRSKPQVQNWSLRVVTTT